MNIEETKKAIKVMQAFVDGKTVQYEDCGFWDEVATPSWDWFGTEYRIKPTEPREIWVNEYGEDAVVFVSQTRAQVGAIANIRSRNPTRTAVRYREVIEE